MEKLEYTAAVDEDVIARAEKVVSALLFEHSDLDEDECDDLAAQVVILVAREMDPDTVESE